MLSLISQVKRGKKWVDGTVQGVTSHANYRVSIISNGGETVDAAYQNVRVKRKYGAKQFSMLPSPALKVGHVPITRAAVVRFARANCDFKVEDGDYVAAFNALGVGYTVEKGRVPIGTFQWDGLGKGNGIYVDLTVDESSSDEDEPRTGPFGAKATPHSTPIDVIQNLPANITPDDVIGIDPGLFQVLTCYYSTRTSELPVDVLRDALVHVGSLTDTPALVPFYDAARAQLEGFEVEATADEVDLPSNVSNAITLMVEAWGTNSQKGMGRVRGSMEGLNATTWLQKFEVSTSVGINSKLRCHATSFI